MSSVAAITASTPPEPTESDHLLDRPHDKQDGDTDEPELVKEPSNAEFTFIMGSLWV